MWACPHCLGPLAVSGEPVRCGACGRCYPVTPAGRPDFRATERLTLRVELPYEPTFGRFDWDRAGLAWPDAKNGLEVAARWAATERHMLAAVPRSERPGAPALDIGCGEAHQRFAEGLLQLGYRPVSIDIAGEAPDALADAHLLPFADAAFDLLTSSAVFEHLKVPHAAMAEAARVARPGALFVGAVAFAEPFHISYFHHSPLAVYELLDGSGFGVEAIVLADQSWGAFRAHLEMGFAGARLPAPVRSGLSRAIYGAALLPAALKAAFTASREPLSRARMAFARSHTAVVGFVARRGAAPPSSRVVRP